MNPNTLYALIWITFAVAISVSVIATKDLTALWVFLIPAFMQDAFNKQ